MNQYVIGLIIQSIIVVIAVAGMFSLTGLAGMVSFGQAAFMAIGAYAMALSAVYWRLPIPIACLFAMVCAGVMALAIGIPTLRLRRDYFALITIGLNEAMIALIITFSDVTYGVLGFSRIRAVKGILWISLAVMVMIIYFMYSFKYSRFGRMCIAIKNDELAARSFGIDVFRLKLKVYIVSCIFASMAGILYAFQTRLIDPYSFGWTRSSEMVIFMFFGGTNSLFGSTLSAFVLRFVPETLRNVTFLGRSLQIYRTILYCFLIIIIINFRPAGVFGEWEPNFSILSRKKAGKEQRNER